MGTITKSFNPKNPVVSPHDDCYSEGNETADPVVCVYIYIHTIHSSAKTKNFTTTATVTLHYKDTSIFDFFSVIIMSR